MPRVPLDYRQPEKPKPLQPVEWLVVCVVGAMVLYALLIVVVLILEDSLF